MHLEYISYPFGCNVVNVVNIYKLADQMYLCIKTQECTWYNLLTYRAYLLFFDII